MRKFVDGSGRTWGLQITVGDIRKARDVLNLDLQGLFSGKCEGLVDLMADPVRLVDLLWVLCEEQAEKIAVTGDMFGYALGGDSLEAGARALVDALIDFFPNQQRRELYRAALQRAETVLSGQLAAVIDKVKTAPETAFRTS